MTENGHFASAIAYSVVKDQAVNDALVRVQKLETIGVGIVQFYHLLAYEQTTMDLRQSVNTYLKNLLFYLH